jgi:hypothetical protein
MFSPDVVGSDAFLDMPTSCRELYFELGMYTDDDGFVNPKRVMRMVGAAENDLDVLIAKEFVIRFKSGVIVIAHWRRNNLIRKDWYRETVYLEEKAHLRAKNGRYIFVNETLPEPLTQDRIGKDNTMQEIPQEIRNKIKKALE